MLEWCVIMLLNFILLCDVVVCIRLEIYNPYICACWECDCDCDYDYDA